MTFLPIVDRELRVAARRPATFRIRFISALVAAVSGGCVLLITLMPAGMPVTGHGLFGFLSMLGLALALLAGPVFTADCLSKEKREGTLGLLFLTDLGGVDVVAGKLVALGLVPLQGLLAIVPILGLSLFMGGVTGAEFGRVGVALLDALWLSLAVGIFVSSMVSDDRSSVGWTLAVLAAVAVLPTLGNLVVGQRWGGARLPLGGWGPFELYLQAFDRPQWTARPTFPVLATGQAVVGGLLVMAAAYLTRRNWRRVDEAKQRPGSDAGRASVRSASGARPSLEGRLFAENPIAWLAWQDSWIRHAARWTAVGTLVLAVGLLLLPLASGGRPRADGPALFLVHLGFYGLKLLLATHVVYFLQDACRQGLMELLLVSSVSSRVLYEGHRAGMRRLILRPALALAIGGVALGIAGRVLDGGDWPDLPTVVLAGFVPSAWNVLVHFADLLAVAVYASVQGLQSDRPSRALLRTVLVVLLAPLAVCGPARIVVDLYFVGQRTPALERFRDLARGWFFPGALGRVFGAPRGT